MSAISSTRGYRRRWITACRFVAAIADGTIEAAEVRQLRSTSLTAPVRWSWRAVSKLGTSWLAPIRRRAHGCSG